MKALHTNVKRRQNRRIDAPVVVMLDGYFNCNRCEYVESIVLPSDNEFFCLKGKCNVLDKWKGRHCEFFVEESECEIIKSYKNNNTEQDESFAIYTTSKYT